MSTQRTCALAALALAAACMASPATALPDLDRGKAALAAGDYEAAKRDLQPLAEMGYLDAQKGLARIYARSDAPEDLKQALYWFGKVADKDPASAVPMARVLVQLGDLQSLARAEQTLRAADARGDARALSNLIELYTEVPELDRQNVTAGLVERAAKLPTPEAEAAVIKWYRLHAGEPRYAKALVERCAKARARIPECYVDLARAYRANKQTPQLKELVASAFTAYAAHAIPDNVMERFGWSLISDDVPGEGDPANAYKVLKQIAAGSTQAQVRVARMLVEYPYVDPEGKPEEMLLKAVQTGSADAALGLGRLYIMGITVPVDPQKAVHYLEQAAKTLPGAHYYLGRIYKKGQLGKPDPVKAAQHFLIAARGGYANADVALAQLFMDNRGVKPDPVDAFVFASLATASGVPAGQELLNQLRSTLTAQQVQNGQKVLQEEIAARRTTRMVADGLAPMPPQEGVR